MSKPLAMLRHFVTSQSPRVGSSSFLVLFCTTSHFLKSILFILCLVCVKKGKMTEKEGEEPRLPGK